MSEAPWWRDAVIYQVYPRSWADSDGDGIGDLPGITARLGHLTWLGVDALWLSPFYPSPQRDGGYDVSDHRDVDPRFGTLADFDGLLARAHEVGLRVLVDLVPNHTSSDHPWFQEALRAEPGSPERSRYLFRDGRGSDGDEPPNNWASTFGGPGWTRITEPDGSPGQWYLHLFDVSQPDLDWASSEVRDELESVLRFWLDRGVDGFRVDVAHGLVKADGLPDADIPAGYLTNPTALAPMWDQPGIHDVYRRWRQIADEYAQQDPGGGAGPWRRTTRPHPLRGGLGQARRCPGSLRARRRAPPVVQLRVPDDAVARRGPAEHHLRDARRRRGRRSTADLGALQPRRRPPRVATGVRAVTRAELAAWHRRRRPAAGRRPSDCGGPARPPP